MIQRICPICDSVMKSAHYCKTCKRWVKNPSMQEVTYRLNETHPRQETDCTYHINPQEVLEQPRPVVQINNAGIPKKREQPMNQTVRNEKSKRTNWTGIIFACIMLFNLAGILINKVVETVGSTSEQWFSSDTPEYDVDLGNFNVGQEGTTIALEDEEVIAAGVACNWQKHFQLQGSELKSYVIDILLPEYEYQVVSDIHYSYNTHYENGDTLYNAWSSLEFQTGEGTGEDFYPSIRIDYDTATGELHGVNVAIRNLEQLGEITTKLLLWMYENEGMASEENLKWIQTIGKEMTVALEVKHSYYFENEYMMVSGMYDEEEASYFLEISKPIS